MLHIVSRPGRHMLWIMEATGEKFYFPAYLQDYGGIGLYLRSRRLFL